MTITAEVQELSSKAGTGCRIRGVHREVIQGKENATTAYQLSTDQSGALCVHGSLTGAVWQLPTPTVGCWFEFFCTLARTSNSTKVVTKDITSEFLLGSVTMGSLTVGDSMDTFTADGTSNHVSITQNGGKTGGKPGDTFVVTAISTTQWVIRGVGQSLSTSADPFASS